MTQNAQVKPLSVIIDTHYKRSLVRIPKILAY
jgi:hypothetical protein